MQLNRQAFANRATLLFRSTTVLLLFLTSCGRPDPPDLISASIIRLEFDSSDPVRMTRYYFGGYLGPDGGDPFERGLTIARDGRTYLNLDSLHGYYPASVGKLDDVNLNNRLEWEELEAFLQGTYHDARGLPETLEGFRARYDYRDAPDDWFAVELNGVMTAARRRVLVPIGALRAAIGSYRQHEQRLLYPAGTAIVGEHYIDGSLRETTAMVKRGDGFWDFVTYDQTGALAGATQTPPRPLASPTQCVGCHFGSKRFEPEASFPAEARPGPHGPRVLHVDPAWRDAKITTFFNEHARRSDTVLGLYSTLFVARLQAEARTGDLSPEDRALLESLQLDS